MKKYDVIVLGSGGGSKITSPAARLGYKVAVIEKDRLGGTCLNRGCIPSKMLIHPADVAVEIKNAKKFDIHNDPTFTVDFEKLVTRINNTTDGDSDKIAASYDKHPNIDYYHGLGKFVSNHVVEVNGEQLTADKIFIGVGARPHIPNFPGLEGTPYMTSTDALRRKDLPKKMVVVGAGYIATELGHAYGALGTEVHFMVRSQFLRGTDSDVVDEFTRVFSEQYHCHLGACPTKVMHENNMFTINYMQDNQSKTMEADALLIATGITPNNDTLALENTSIELTSDGFIKVDDCLQTTVDGIWAMGDCVGNYFFRHSVNFEGEYLFDSVFQNDSLMADPIEYPPVPHAVFTHPQVAGVGLTEDICRAQNIDYVVGLNAYKSSAMGMALLSDHGFCKLIIERRTRKILGCHIIGPEASDMIHTVIAFMNMNATLDDMLRMIYIHPALPEIVRNAARKANAAF